jgi:hypothetical protein
MSARPYLKNRPGMVACATNPSYLGGKGEGSGLKGSLGKKNTRLYLKNNETQRIGAQVVEHLSTKHNALNSCSSIT